MALTTVVLSAYYYDTIPVVLQLIFQTGTHFSNVSSIKCKCKCQKYGGKNNEIDFKSKKFRIHSSRHSTDNVFLNYTVSCLYYVLYIMLKSFVVPACFTVLFWRFSARKIIIILLFAYFE